MQVVNICLTLILLSFENCKTLILHFLTPTQTGCYNSARPCHNLFPRVLMRIRVIRESGGKSNWPGPGKDRGIDAGPRKPREPFEHRGTRAIQAAGSDWQGRERRNQNVLLPRQYRESSIQMVKPPEYWRQISPHAGELKSTAAAKDGRQRSKSCGHGGQGQRRGCRILACPD